MGKVAFYHWASLSLELLLAIVTFSLFLDAYPDKYRTTLWHVGGELGWNSNPRLRIYFYANYKEPPPIARVWDQSSTTANLAIAAVPVVTCIAKGTMHFFGYSIHTVATLLNIILSIMWAVSITGQLGSDLTDTEHLSLYPWYLTKNCHVVQFKAFDACVAGQACFAFSIISLLLYLSRLFLSALLWAYRCGENRVMDGILAKIPCLNWFTWDAKSRYSVFHQSEGWADDDATETLCHSVEMAVWDEQYGTEGPV